jgi:hypothetical protein
MKTKVFYLFALIVLTLGCWRSAGFLLSRLGPDWLPALAIAAWLFVSAMALAATRVSHRAWIYVGLLVLAVLSLPSSVFVRILPDRPLLGFGLTLLMPPVAVPITLLLYSGLASNTWQSAGMVGSKDPQAEHKQAERAAVVLVLSALTLVCWQFAVLVFGFGFSSPLISCLIVIPIVVLFVSGLALAARRASHSVWICAGLLNLAGLFLPASLFVMLPGPLGEPLSSTQAMMLLLILSMALVTAALLLNSGLNLLNEWRDTGALESGGSQARRKYVGKIALLVLALGSLLLAKTLHNLYWFMVWDTTGDSLEYFWLAIPVPAVLLCGVVLSIVLPGRTKLVGFLYSLLIPVLMIGVSACALRVDFRQLTEERAGRVSQAIEAYYDREGRYPQDLRELTPLYTLSFPGPVIIYGQYWCYDGGEDYYRLGYLDREHWSSPILFGRVYSAKGHSPLKVDVCQPAIDTYREQHPDWESVLQDYGQPMPTPDMGE